MVPQELTAIKYFISLVLKCSRKGINLAELSLLHWSSPRNAESGLVWQLYKLFFTTEKRDAGIYVTAWKVDFLTTLFHPLHS